VSSFGNDDSQGWIRTDLIDRYGISLRTIQARWLPAVYLASGALFLANCMRNARFMRVIMKRQVRMAIAIQRFFRAVRKVMKRFGMNKQALTVDRNDWRRPASKWFSELLFVLERLVIVAFFVYRKTSILNYSWQSWYLFKLQRVGLKKRNATNIIKQFLDEVKKTNVLRKSDPYCLMCVVS